MSQSQSRLVGKASPIDLKGAVVMIAYAIGVGANEGYKKAKKANEKRKEKKALKNGDTAKAKEAAAEAELADQAGPSEPPPQYQEDAPDYAHSTALANQH